MTQEQIKAKAKEQFPNDEFKQQAVIDAINWATKELQKENARLKEINTHTLSQLNLDNGELIIENEKLTKENTDLKYECRRCIYTDSPCVLSDYGKDRNGICDHFKDVFDENAELKDYRLTTLAKQQTDMSKYALNLEHKLSWYDDQLTKAKELLKRCYDTYVYEVSVRREIEQFLKDSEVEK